MQNRYACWRSGSIGVVKCLLLAACGSGSVAPLDAGLASPSNGSSGNGLSGGGGGGDSSLAASSGSAGNSGGDAASVLSNDSGNAGAGSGAASSAGQAGGGSGGTSSGSSGGSGTAAGSGRSGTSPTMLPTPNGACPSLQNGTVTVTAGGGSIQATLWVGTARVGTAGAQGGPLILYWHGTGSNPTSEVSAAFDTNTVVAAGGIVAGFLANSRTGTPTGTTGNNVWYQSDALFADQLVACAIRANAIDPRRIHTAGYSAGALQAVYMSYARSGYIASAISYSGGTDGLNQTKYQDPSNVPAAIAAHGAQGKDVVGLDFAQASASWESAIKQSGGFSIDCNDGGNHIDFFAKRAPALKPVALPFFADHPFKTAPEPYTTLPSGFPSYCRVN